jgi:four helix bundle protein
MDEKELKELCMNLALRCWKLTEHLPNTAPGRNVASQISRSASSVAANYRAACRSRSKAEWISKLGQVLEEADETLLWIELIERSGMLPAARLESLKQDAEKLVKIFTASLKKSKI